MEQALRLDDKSAATQVAEDLSASLKLNPPGGEDVAFDPPGNDRGPATQFTLQ
jgi:hypothetical protein